MVITWRVDAPPECAEHGPLADVPLAGLGGGIAVLEHLRDVHGANVARALASLTARQDQAATMAP